MSNKLKQKLANPEYRKAYVAEHVKTWIARQIRTLREQRDWSQTEMGRRVKKPQSTISRLEDPDYGQMTVQTLLDMAGAFDVALEVRFLDYDSFLTRTRELSANNMVVSSYDEASLSSERAFGVTAWTDALVETRNLVVLTANEHSKRAYDYDVDALMRSNRYHNWGVAIDNSNRRRLTYYPATSDDSTKNRDAIH